MKAKKLVAVVTLCSLVMLSPGLEFWACAYSMFEAGSVVSSGGSAIHLPVGVDVTAAGAVGLGATEQGNLLDQHGLKTRLSGGKRPSIDIRPSNQDSPTLIRPAATFSLPPSGRREQEPNLPLLEKERVGVRIDVAGGIDQLEGLERKPVDAGVLALGRVFERMTGFLRKALPVAANGVAPGRTIPEAMTQATFEVVVPRGADAQTLLRLLTGLRTQIEKHGKTGIPRPPR